MFHTDRETGEVTYAISRTVSYHAVLPEGHRQDCVRITLVNGGALMRYGTERVRMTKLGANRA